MPPFCKQTWFVPVDQISCSHSIKEFVFANVLSTVAIGNRQSSWSFKRYSASSRFVLDCASTISCCSSSSFNWSSLHWIASSPPFTCLCFRKICFRQESYFLNVLVQPSKPHIQWKFGSLWWHLLMWPSSCSKVSANVQCLDSMIIHDNGEMACLTALCWNYFLLNVSVNLWTISLLAQFYQDFSIAHIFGQNHGRVHV